MGTRGIFGFFHKGKFYSCYNHQDSYPSGLGVALIREILKANLDEWIALLEKIKVVNKNRKPTEEDIQKLEKYSKLYNVESTSNWNGLLYWTEGSFHHVLHSGYLINHIGANGKPLFEEYGYILNFDERTLDFYRGYENISKKKIPLNNEDIYACAQEWVEYDSEEIEKE